MAASLVPCPSCQRHVRATERACPFCRSALSSALAAKVVPGATQRLSRAAAFTFAATLAATGCGPTADPADSGSADAPAATDNGTPTDDGALQAMYGGPPRDSGAAVDAGVPDDHGGIQPLYGAPVFDSGVDGGGPQDSGGVMALYGVPPPHDSGVEQDDSGGPHDDGSVHALYGLPAPVDGGSIGVRYGSPPHSDAG